MLGFCRNIIYDFNRKYNLLIGNFINIPFYSSILYRRGQILVLFFINPNLKYSQQNNSNIKTTHLKQRLILNNEKSIYVQFYHYLLITNQIAFFITCFFYLCFLHENYT